MFYEVLIFGGFWFWTFLAVVAIMLTATVESNKADGATFIAVVAFLILCAFSNVNPLSFIYNNPVTSLLLVTGYIVVGGAYAVLKWYFFVLKKAETYRALRGQFLEEKKLTDIVTDKEKEEFASFRRYSNLRDAFPLQAVAYTGRITSWMVYWPFSAAWTVLNDPLRIAFQWVRVRLAGSMQRISNRVFGEFSELN